MSDARGNEPITCTSCEYRYPRSAGVCPMCGKPAPAIEPLQVHLAIPDEFSGADHEAVSRWITGCQQQENAECDIKAQHHRQRRLLPDKHQQGINQGRKTNPDHHQHDLERRFSTHSTPSIRVANNVIAGQLLQLRALSFGLLQDRNMQQSSRDSGNSLFHPNRIPRPPA